MKWLFLAHRASRSCLNSQQFHLYGGLSFGSRYRCIHASDSMGYPKSLLIPSCSYQMQSSDSCHRFSTSMSESAYSFLNGTKNEYYMKKLDLEIVSRETIKPASPTPPHRRSFNLSIIDQIIYDYYTPIILFIPNSNKASVTDVMSKRLKHLKETLSQILIQFYPLAGEVKDRLHIECNDKGVNFIVARVNQTLEEYLCNPEDEKVRELMPESPRIAESAIGNYVLGVQMNIFNCGGIGLSTIMTHKFMDFHTYTVFMKAWATAVRGAPETISPSFVASEVFPNDPSQEYSLPSELVSSDLLSTKRFVFNPTALAVLKAQLVQCTSPPSRGPTRMEATLSVIWNAAAKAASTVRPFSQQSPHAVLAVVNLRKRASPPLPDNTIGNIFVSAAAICLPESRPKLPTLMGALRESIAKINSNYIESMKGEQGHETFKDILKGIKYLASMTKAGDCMFASSLLNSGIYELDFGWGKPNWFYVVNQGNRSFVILTDTQQGSGVEATVTLTPDEMQIFERDPELLSYATVNPTPLRFFKH